MFEIIEVNNHKILGYQLYYTQIFKNLNFYSLQISNINQQKSDALYQQLAEKLLQNIELQQYSKINIEEIKRVLKESLKNENEILSQRLQVNNPGLQTIEKEQIPYNYRNNVFKRKNTYQQYKKHIKEALAFGDLTSDKISETYCSFLQEKYKGQ